MNECPHCGSTNSFEYTATLITKRIGFWGKNDDEESEVENSKFPKTVRCGDCRKRVNFDIAHGKAVEHGVQRTVCTSCKTELSESNVYCPKCGLWNPANRR